jgi:hypothetical protein
MAYTVIPAWMPESSVHGLRFRANAAMLGFDPVAP